MFSKGRTDPVALSISKIVDRNRVIQEQTAALNKKYRVEHAGQVNQHDAAAYNAELAEINESIQDISPDTKSAPVKNTLRRLANLYLDENMSEFNKTARQLNEAKMPSGKYLADNVAGVDHAEKHKDGTYTLRREFFYSHGATSQGHADRVSAGLNELGIKHSVVGHGRVDKPFKGGGTVKQNSHFWIKVKPHTDEVSEARLDEIGDTPRGEDRLRRAARRSVIGAQNYDKKSSQTWSRAIDRLERGDGKKYKGYEDHGQVHYDLGTPEGDQFWFNRPKKYGKLRSAITGRKSHGWFEESRLDEAKASHQLNPQAQHILRRLANLYLDENMSEFSKTARQLNESRESAEARKARLKVHAGKFYDYTVANRSAPGMSTHHINATDIHRILDRKSRLSHAELDKLEGHLNDMFPLNESRLDEISSELKKRYIKKALPDMGSAAYRQGEGDTKTDYFGGNEELDNHIQDMARKGENRFKGIMRAVNGLKEDRLDEISKKTLGSYINRAATSDEGNFTNSIDDLSSRMTHIVRNQDKDESWKRQFNQTDDEWRKLARRWRNRKAGIARAVDKLTEAKAPHQLNPQAQHILRAGDKIVHGYRHHKWPAEFLGYSHEDEKHPKYAHMDDVPHGMFPEKASAHFRDMSNGDTYQSYYHENKWRIGSSADVAKITHNKQPDGSGINEDRVDEKSIVKKVGRWLQTKRDHTAASIIANAKKTRKDMGETDPKRVKNLSFADRRFLTTNKHGHMSDGTTRDGELKYKVKYGKNYKTSDYM